VGLALFYGGKSMKKATKIRRYKGHEEEDDDEMKG